MANQEHLNILRQGVVIWNNWRQEYPEIDPDLTSADLIDADLSGANLIKADIIEARANRMLSLSDIEVRLPGAETDLNFLIKYFKGSRYLTEILLEDYSKGINLSFTDLSFATLRGANLSGANLSFTTLRGANLSGANLYHANLSFANLSTANLEKADLGRTNLIEANLEKANLAECFVYGVSAWDVKLRKTVQSDLIITRPWQPTITVDNLEIAQLIYLLLNTQKIREVIDTITSKIVLILGRFTPERKEVLDAIKNALRKQNYLPVLFDFEKPESRDLTETVSTLAHLARFIIVDLTDPSSAPHEVASVIPQTVVPVQPLLTLQPLVVDGKAVERHEYAMFEDLRRRYQWVLPTFRYQDTADLLASLQKHIIEPAEQKAQELAKR